MIGDRDLVTLRELHDAMLADLRAHYLDRVETIAAYDLFSDLDDQDRQPVTTPALLIGIESIDPGEDDGTGRQPLQLTFSAHCILSFRTSGHQLELREFAADLLAHVRYNRWGYPGAVHAPVALSAQPGEFQPGLAGYDSWLATWEQTIYVGPDLWAGGIAPQEVWLGIAPKIGADHVEDYFPIDTPPQVTQ